MANTAKNPKTTANVAQIVFITWITGLLRLGIKRPLTDDDLFPLEDEEDKTEHAVANLQQEWQSELTHSKRFGQQPRIYKALIRSSRSKHVRVLILKGIDVVFILLMPLLLSYLLKELSKGESMNIKAASLLVAGISGSSYLKSLVYCHGKLIADMLDVRWKTALTGLIYRKVLILCRGSLIDVTTGNIMNLISNDVQRVEDLNFFAIHAIYAPVKIVVAVTLLSILVGWQCLGGIMFMVLVTIYNMLAARMTGSLRAKAAVITDKRLGAINDVIRGMRAVKIYAWEWNFRNLIETLRRQEVLLMRLRSFLTATCAAVLKTTSSTASLISIATLVFTRERAISPSEIFTLVSLLDVLAFAISAELGDCVRYVIDAKVTIDRVESFLLGVNDEINYECKEDKNFVARSMISRRVISRVKSLRKVAKIMRIQSFRKNTPVLRSLNGAGVLEKPKGSEKVGQVNMGNVSAGWNRTSETLQGVTLKVTSGQLVIITGPVGSGKSTMLMAIQGELHITAGTIQRSGKIAYVSQTPWVFSATLRDNITFGKEFQKEAFEKAVHVCDLQEDFKLFPKGDLSVVGQRGVSLSGGQRARVTLARAVYSDADIYLLDDPLSAVDAKVGSHIFRECVCGALSGKTRILVTHHLQYLEHADHVLLLKGGKIEHIGTSYEILSKRLVDEENDQEASSEHRKSLLGDEDIRLYGNTIQDDKSSGICDMEEEDEDHATGSVKLQLYWTYFRAGLPPVLLIVLFMLLIVMEASILAPYWWLTRISDKPQDQKSSLTLGIYAALVAWAITFTIVVLCLVLFATLRSSERLHNRMTTAVLKSPMLFFDTNPLGRIINRFSKDVGSMDAVIPIKIVWALILIIDFLGRLILTAVAEYILATAVVPVVAVFFLLSRFYLKSSRELQRIEAVKCSSVYAHFTDTLAGLEVIKTAEMRERFWETFTRYQDERTRAAVIVKTANNWMSLYVDLLCASLVTAVATSSLLIGDPSASGMILTLAITLIGETSYGVNRVAEVENEMTSVERVVTYTKLPSEPGYDRPAIPRETWPEQGAICFQGVSLTYRKGNPRVLHRLNLDIPAKQRVGVAGRTGAGKSSLIAALFRLPEPDGKVLIDGIDLGAIDIQSARRAIAVISQDSVLFGGSLRKNMDPFYEFTDEKIWTTLEAVQLFETIQKLPGQLNFEVGECGASFSVGERELLCLARALLQKSKVLVLDEATANVDYKTDLLVQQVLRNKFADCTLLTIAHRLNTIMDYDKVVVMDKGRIVECDEPRVLLAKNDGAFARLARNQVARNNVL